MTRPFYRSRLFWLGGPGMIFLLWVWFVAQKEWTLVWTDRLSSTSLVYEPGVVGIIRTTMSPDYDVIYSDLGFQQLSNTVAPKDLEYFGWSLSWSTEAPFDPRIRTSRLSVPLWLLTPLYTACWLGSVLWWQRRKARLNPSAAPLP